MAHRCVAPTIGRSDLAVWRVGASESRTVEKHPVVGDSRILTTITPSSQIVQVRHTHSVVASSIAPDGRWSISGSRA